MEDTESCSNDRSAETMLETFYPTDLTDAEWNIIDFMLPLEKKRGKQRRVDFREVVNAIFYRADNGIKWRAMPLNFPAWQTVYKYYRALGEKWVVGGHQCSVSGASPYPVRTSCTTEFRDN